MEDIDLNKVLDEIENIPIDDEPEEEIEEQPRNIFQDFIIRLLWDYRGIIINLNIMYDIWE
jgi:hypothetical protein